MPLRLTPLYSKDLIEKADHLTADEKAEALANIERLQAMLGQVSEPSAIAQNDPEGARAFVGVATALNALVGNAAADEHVKGGTILNLLVVNAVRSVGDPMLLSMLLGVASKRMLDGFQPYFWMLMDYPENECWTEEQALALKFSRAVLDGKMTDAIWNGSVEKWGVKGVMRYIHFMGGILGPALLNRAISY